MKPSVGVFAIVVAISVVVLTASADSVAFPHIVRRGESLGQIAERVYGRLELERLIVAVNGLHGARGSTIVPGMRLELPAVGYHKVLPGETWKTIAAARLGHPDRNDVLAQLNGANPWLRPPIGSEIVIPYNLRYVASRGDTTQTVAYRFLGRRDGAYIVASYNLFKRASLRQGEVVLVPLTDLTLTEAGKQAALNAGALVRSETGGGAREAQKKASAELPRLVQDVRHGHYIEAIARGAAMLRLDLSESQLARIHEQLTVAYVALEARGLAATSCSAWLRNDPSVVLNPIDHSPKILAVCLGEAGTHGEAGKAHKAGAR